MIKGIIIAALLLPSTALAISWEQDPRNEPGRNAYERQQDEWRYKNHDTQRTGPLWERVEDEARQRRTYDQPDRDTYQDRQDTQQDRYRSPYSTSTPWNE